MTPFKAYLAGPGVFRHGVAEFATGLKDLCRTHGLEPLWPIDNAISSDPDKIRWAINIRTANEAMIRAANAVIADISPFRGPSMDPGTAYEIGYAIALGKPVFAWSDDARTLLARTALLAGTTQDKGAVYDSAGFEIEDFGLRENLMIATAVRCVLATSAEAVAACADHLKSTTS
jgi:nucleoside 2-deoxyribosyltransferase